MNAIRGVQIAQEVDYYLSISGDLEEFKMHLDFLKEELEMTTNQLMRVYDEYI